MKSSMMAKIFVNIKMKTLMEKQITPGDSSEEKLFNYDENTMISRKFYLQQKLPVHKI